MFRFRSMCSSTAVFTELRDQRMVDSGRHRVRASNRVPAVHQYFRLDDRHETRLLRQGCDASQGVRVHPDAVLARDLGVDRDDSAPLGEPCSELAVLREALA
jgi:hypothetical protein